MYCDCKCSVALSRGVVGWSALCDMVLPDNTHLPFRNFNTSDKI